jgi:hypothetical protein
MRPRYVKVDKLSKPVKQTDYLTMLGEVMQSLKVSEGRTKPAVTELTKELGIRTNKEMKE